MDIQSGQRRHEIVGACACDDCPDKKDFFPLDWFDDDHPVLVDEYTVFKSGKVNKDYDPRARRADGRSDESSRDSPRRRVAATPRSGIVRLVCRRSRRENRFR